MLAVLFQSINDNLVLNHEKETEMLMNMVNDIQKSIVLQNAITGLIVEFVSFVTKTYSLLNHVKSMLLSLYLLVYLYDVDDMMFDVVNSSFKALFLDFHMNYVRCKKNNIQDMLDISNGGFSVDDFVESNETKLFYHDAVDKLSKIDDEFLLLVKNDDLFSFPKMYLKKFSINESIVFDLKQFDIDYIIESDDIVDGVFDVVVSDEYIQMELLEKEENISLLFDVGASDDASCYSGISIVDADINDMNIDELEEMLL